MNIDRFLLEDVQNPEHPSEFETANGYELLILRLPRFTKSSLEIYSEAFIIKEDSVYLYKRDSSEFMLIGDFQKFSDTIDDKLDALIKNLQKYHIEIDNLEESLFDNSLDANFMHKWLTFKKEMSLVSRLTFHANLAFELFVNFQKKKQNSQNLSFNDNLEHLRRIENLAKSSLEKLDNLYNFYRAKVDEKMNKNMYVLTIISGIFLPLTLITGFFGMNSGGLPYTDDPNGTTKVVILSIILEILFLVPFFLLNRHKTKRYDRNLELDIV